MLRRTAARAFGAAGPERAPMPPAPHETLRDQAVGRLFRDLHARLEAAATLDLATGAVAGEPVAGEGVPTGPVAGEPVAGEAGPTGPVEREPVAGEVVAGERGLSEQCARGGDLPLRVTKIRALAGGVEFTLEGPGASFVFLDTLAGLIQVGRVSRASALSRASGPPGALEPFEILAIQLQGGIFRPVRKRAGFPAGARAPRTPFRFTTAAELEREYRQLAKSIHKIDTPALVP